MQKNNKLLQIFLLTFTVFLSGCGVFGDKDNTPKPTALVPIVETAKFHLRWSANTGRGAQKYDLRLKPAIVDDKIFVADFKGQVTAYDVTTGKLRWRMQSKMPLSSGISVDHAVLAAGTSDARLLILNQSDGRILQTISTSNEILANPAIAKNKVLAQSIDGNLQAFDLRTGQAIWTHKQGAPALMLRGGSTPQVTEKSAVIAGFSDGKLVMLTLSDGHVIWEREIAFAKGTSVVERMVDIDSDPVIDGNTVYVATYQGQIAALSLESGRILWQRDISVYAGIGANSTTVFATDTNGKLWAFDKHSGSIKWQQENLLHRNPTGPTVAGNLLFVGDQEGYVHAVSTEDGHIIARHQLDNNPIVVAPMVYQSVIYVFASNGKLAAYQLNV